MAQSTFLLVACGRFAFSTQRQAGLTLLGDVLHHGQKARRLALGHGHAGFVDVHPHHSAVGVNVALVAQEAGDLALAQLGLVFDLQRQVIRMGQVHPVLSAQCIAGAAGQVGEALVEVDDAVGGPGSISTIPRWDCSNTVRHSVSGLAVTKGRSEASGSG